MKHLSYSSLKAFAKSPSHYLEYISREFKETPAMTLGKAFHCLLLEQEEFTNRYAIAPKCDKRTKAGKEEWESFSAENPNKAILDGGDYDTILRMMESVNREERKSLIGITAEVGITGTISDVEFKGIVDGISPKHIVDIKTTQDASPKAFQKQAYDLMYHLQAAIYCEITGVQDYYILAVENNAPYNVQEYHLSFELVQAGRVQLFELIRKFKMWDGTPEAYSIGSLELELPKWAR